MAVKIADTLKALSNTFPVAECVDIDVNINGTTKRLQKAIDDGEIGGGSDSTWKGTHEEWEALSTEEKGKYEVICFTDDYDESGICGSDSTWKGTHEEWEALSTEEKGKYEVVYFTDDYDDSGIGESDSIWKGTRDEWEALLTAEKQKYVIVYFTDDYDAADSTGLIDDTNTSGKTTYSSSKIENSLSKKANTTDLTTHTSDTDIHVTTSDKTKWNNSVNKTDIIDNLTSINTDKPLSAKQGKVLKDDIGLKANATDLTSHASNKDIHITTAERTKWNKVDNKVDKTNIIDNLTSTNTDKPLSANQGKVLKGEVDKKANDNEVIKKTSIVTTLDSTTTNDQIVGAKKLYDLFVKDNYKNIIISLSNNSGLSDYGISDISTYTDFSTFVKDIYSICGHGVKFVIQINTTVVDVLYTNGIIPINEPGILIINNPTNRGNALYTTDRGNIYTNTIPGITDASWYGWQKVAVGDYNLKTYTDINQLGLTAPVTVGEIFSAMPNFSLLRFQVDNYSVTDAPAPNGILIIDKIRSAKFSIEFKISADGTVAQNSLYIGQLKGSDASGLTWQRVCTTSVADVVATNITPTFPSTVTFGKTNITRYSIKNGWANVTIIMNLIASPKLDWTSITTELPKPDKEVYVAYRGETGINNANVAFRLKVNGSLDMLVRSEITKSDWWNFSFSYPVAEQ